MKKVAVILHGWPVPVNQSRGLWKYLEWKGYEVIVPKYMEMQDDFSISAVQNLIENALKGQKPDLIMGLSLGGLMLPFIAEKYPKAQLIFVATGCRLAPKVGWFPRLVQAIAGRGGKFGAVLLQHIPG